MFHIILLVLPNLNLIFLQDYSVCIVAAPYNVPVYVPIHVEEQVVEHELEHDPPHEPHDELHPPNVIILK